MRSLVAQPRPFFCTSGVMATRRRMSISSTMICGSSALTYCSWICAARARPDVLPAAGRPAVGTEGRGGNVDQSGDCSMVRTEEAPLRVGERMPDVELHGPDGRPVRLHDLIDDSFVALYFTDVRRRPPIPSDMPGLKHLIVSRRDAPLDSGLRGRSLFGVRRPPRDETAPGHAGQYRISESRSHANLRYSSPSP